MGRVGHFLKDRQGAAAVEFAMVVFPLVTLLLSICDIGLTHWRGFALDASVQASIRSFYADAVNAPVAPGGTMLDRLRGSICGATSPLIDCTALKVDVASYVDWTSVPNASPIDPSTGTWRPDFGQQHGCFQKGNVAVVRAAIAIKSLNPFIVSSSQFADGSQLIQSSSVVLVTQTPPGAPAC